MYRVIDQGPLSILESLNPLRQKIILYNTDFKTSTAYGFFLDLLLKDAISFTSVYFPT